MKGLSFFFKNSLTLLSALATVGTVLCAPAVNANELTSQVTDKSETISKHDQNKFTSYILGPGDNVDIELLELPELSGNFSVGPDGNLYLPRLRFLRRRSHSLNTHFA